ncbi:MAG: DUF4398 domain-containing protein [Myxococcota bacterium]
MWRWALLLIASCGPIQTTTVIVDSEAAVAAARLAQAAERAPYELAAAEAYLEKAREEHGRADFEDAVDLGERALQCAWEALAKAEGRQGSVQPRIEGLQCRPRAETTQTSSTTSAQVVK